MWTEFSIRHASARVAGGEFTQHVPGVNRLENALSHKGTPKAISPSTILDLLSTVKLPTSHTQGNQLF